jgi:hypothetical protein
MRIQGVISTNLAAVALGLFMANLIVLNSTVFILGWVFVLLSITITMIPLDD